MEVRGRNPLIGQDYPDADVIRVADTYYMISTTMYFMPGGVILRSYDLVNWEIASYVFHTLDHTPAQMLVKKENIYGQGMWAASFRYHKGMFYVCFVCNDTHKTYLYQSKNIEGPWKKQNIEGFYHDPSLFFDEDDRIYIIYGNKTIHLTELNQELTGPKAGGMDRIIVEEKDNPGLGYEGTHFYKIDGRYYAFFIHSLKDRWFRAEACFWSDSLEGEFIGKDVLADDMGYRNAGVAQGGIVDTPDGSWYAVLFQDRGAVGRIPVLVPIHWENKIPVFGVEGKVPKEPKVISLRPEYQYEAVYTSDDFHYKTETDGMIHLKKQWQWNHSPHEELWTVEERKGALRLYSGKICSNLTEGYNTLTQRTMEPASAASVIIDGAGMKDKDAAGLAALLGGYAAVALTYENGSYFVVMLAKDPRNAFMSGKYEKDLEEIIYEKIQIDSPVIKLRCSVDYRNAMDKADFYYQKDGSWISIGISHRLVFGLDHFMGCRFGLFYYSKKQIGGRTDFMEFIYEPPQINPCHS